MDKKLINEKGVEWLVYKDGRIFRPSFDRHIKRIRNGQVQEFKWSQPETELQPCVLRGYKVVSAKKGNTRPKMLVHRLLAIAFVEGYSPELSVNHINGNKLDNRLENLEWVTLAENTKHQWRTGLVDLRGEKQPNHKLTQRQVMHIRKALKLGVPSNSLSIIANVNPSTIHLIKQGKRWAHLVDSCPI